MYVTGIDILQVPILMETLGKLAESIEFFLAPSPLEEPWTSSAAWINLQEASKMSKTCKTFFSPAFYNFENPFGKSCAYHKILINKTI